MQVILADSNELIRLGLRTILNAHAGIHIAGEAKNQDELMAQLKTFGADVVLIDFTAQGFSIDIVPKALAKYKAAHIAISTGIIDQKKSASRSSAICQVRSSRNNPQII